MLIAQKPLQNFTKCNLPLLKPQLRHEAQLFLDTPEILRTGSDNNHRLLNRAPRNLSRAIDQLARVQLPRTADPKKTGRGRRDLLDLARRPNRQPAGSRQAWRLGLIARGPERRFPRRKCIVAVGPCVCAQRGVGLGFVLNQFVDFLLFFGFAQCEVAVVLRGGVGAVAQRHKGEKRPVIGDGWVSALGHADPGFDFGASVADDDRLAI